MLIAIRKRLAHKEEGGFTLIELMVVVLIIAILIAIAIPTFLGARKRAQDRAAQSSLRNSLTSAKVIFTDGEDYTQATVAALAAAEPSLTFVAEDVLSTGAKVVSTNPSSATVWAAAALSASGTCYFIKDTSTAGTTFGSTATAADCDGVHALTAAGTAW